MIGKSDPSQEITFLLNCSIIVHFPVHLTLNEVADDCVNFIAERTVPKAMTQEEVRGRLVSTRCYKEL